MFLHWGGPELLGGNLLSAPNAVTWAAGRLDVFGVDGDTTELLHWWWDNGWGGPEALGGKLSSSPRAVSWASGRLDVFGADAFTSGLLHWWGPF
jgi:hypothetical protein